MATHDRVTKDMIAPYGEENAVASFYKWMKDMFEPDLPVYYDKDGSEFSVRNLAKFPSILVQQIDTQDLTTTFIGGKHNLTNLLFYIYFNHSLKNSGSRRLLRRGRDQISTALKLAGVCPAGSDIPVYPPIYLWDFSKKPIARLSGCLTLKGGIQQRFIQEDDILQHELMCTFQYCEVLIP